MKDLAENGQPRGAAVREESPQSPGSLRSWLRRVFRQRTESDLRNRIEGLIEKQEGAGDLPATSDEITLLRNILNLHGLSVDDIMVPRADIVAVDIDTPLPELARLMSQEGHSRIPVYRGSLDEIEGMIHIKDVLGCLDREPPARLRDIVRRVLFVAPSMPILELLLQMRVTRVHLALVVDEFGGIDGLATIEDLVEEIVGEIEDEHDDDVLPSIRERADGSLDADARVALKDFEERVGPMLTPEERDEDIDTLGGLVFYLAGRVPVRGEVIRHDTGTEFEILDADPRRVRRMRIRFPRREEEDGVE